MIIDDIISGIDEGGPKSYYSFETFIQHLFKHHIENQDKRFLISTESSRFGDAIAPEGFDSFDGPTVIEIKFNLATGSIRRFLDKLSHQFLNEYVEQKFSNLLVISAKPIPEKVIYRFHEELSRNNLPFRVTFWGPQELNKVAAKHRKVVNKIANNLFALRLSSAISKPIRDWKEEREEIIENLKQCYKKGQFSLLLGAGVSSSAGMPDWNTLLNSLFVTYLTQEFDDDTAIGEKDIGELVQRLNSIDEPSALMAARYLRKGLSKRDGEAKLFIEAVTKNLYKLRNTNFQIDSELIKSIAAMCLPRRTGAKVKSVVTYNFDDLIERQLSNNAIHHRCIYTDNESYDPDELPIYHVHGFLPEERKSFDGLDESTLVFSEEGYHQIYSDSYHWSNLVQLNSFRENTCLMVGLSMTDPNLRRLLEISSKNIERSKHFAFMKRLSSKEFCYEKEKGKTVSKIENVESAEKFLDRHHTLNEELMKELGVTIIWYESYEEIPEIIKRVSKYEN
ncbi:SIR2 family protein [Pseudoalteromonas sp. SG43-5]|uniref:SIR2 family protein n=1 Tax=Pseudoalteromonas sp. SG43-5 TaxID=2760968 RepID=UPI001601660E|nr:SIR2 family protein [Pseudoalteromonas sp. SG43-5]MBB1453752.1 SIR2 family protein [Pseudoalteromonas sp. SG43-5]